jgi:hypothetical protein
MTDAGSRNPMQAGVRICDDGTHSHSSHAERQSMMHDDRIAEVRRLYHHIHRDDPLPQNEREHQAAFVPTRMQQMVLDLLMQGVTPTTLELAHGLSEAQCDARTADMEPSCSRW